MTVNAVVISFKVALWMLRLLKDCLYRPPRFSSAYPVTSRMPNCKRHETKTVTCRSGMMRSCNHLPHNVAKIANTIVRHLFANDTQS
jgi:hypothetical protein